MYIDKEDTVKMTQRNLMQLINSLNIGDHLLIGQVNIDYSVALIFCIFHTAGGYFLVGQVTINFSVALITCMNFWFSAFFTLL